MFIEKEECLQIRKKGESTFVDLGEYIVEVKYQYNKLWGPDSGRNLAGKQSGTLIGVFPKIIVQFRKLTQDELETLVPILDSATQEVRYYDPFKQAYRTMETYTGDYEIVNRSVIEDSNKRVQKNEGFSISFIPNERRR